MKKLESLLLGKTHHKAVGLSSGTGSLKARDRVVLKQRCLLAIPNLVFLRLSGSAETVIKLSYSRLLSEQSHFSYDSENCRKTVRITVVHGILLWVGARMRSEYKIKREKFKYILLTLCKVHFFGASMFPGLKFPKWKLQISSSSRNWIQAVNLIIPRWDRCSRYASGFLNLSF